MSAHNFGKNAYDYAAHHAAIPDPGNAGNIGLEPGKSLGYCSIKTAGAETRTLLAPAAAGLHLTLSMDVDGGDCVIATPAAINAAGNNRITLNDPGDNVELRSVLIAGLATWRLISNDGAALSTV